jgi:hypothetical protein
MVNFFYLDKDPEKCAEYYCDKHIVKIPIEIAQILSKIHHELKTGIDYNKIYKNSIVVKNTIGPYIWASESYENYIWTTKLGLALINQYKLRYNKKEHKTEKILQLLYENVPSLPKIGITKFKGTNKFDMFQYISDDPIICARYNYTEMKCKNDKWTKNERPSWFDKIEKNIIQEKKDLINKIDKQVRETLPKLVTKGDKVYRFHSFLRVSYDNLFQGKWDIKAKLMNKFNPKKPLLYQLTYPQLYFVYKITKSLENKKTLSLLNTQSLIYRKKLKFPNRKINYRNNSEYYIYTKSIDGALIVEPYKSEIDYEEKSSTQLYNLFLKYIKKNDLIGADMCRKYVQINNESLDLIYNNEIYKKWINRFNWKNAEPFKPNKYILYK